MIRPLTVIAISIIMIATFSTNLTAIACKDSADAPGGQSEVSGGCSDDAVTVSVCISTDLEDRSAIDTVKSTLRASKAVCRAMTTTATVVASSMARAAKLAAVALVETAYSLV
ncbi:MAG: hypothetical protein PVF33_08570 [Candidatus Latescibacterota bacterium]|jgi:hypothetical protein